jgi:secreted protein with Ig-like and vWFA domain
MLLQLVFEDQWCIPLLLDDRLREALDAQRERASQGELDVAFSDRISASVSQSISACLDPDLQLPTDSQMKYATDIARELGVSLSADVLRFRGAAHEFIARFEDAFRARRARRTGRAPTTDG